MNNQAAWIEQPFSTAGTEKWLKGNVRQVTEMYTESLLMSGLYRDISLASQSDSKLELLQAGRLKVLSPNPLNVGDSLSVDIEVAGQGEALKTLAVVVREIPQKVDGMYVSALRFIGVNQSGAPKMSSGTLPAQAGAVAFA